MAQADVDRQQEMGQPTDSMHRICFFCKGEYSRQQLTRHMLAIHRDYYLDAVAKKNWPALFLQSLSLLRTNWGRYLNLYCGLVMMGPKMAATLPPFTIDDYAIQLARLEAVYKMAGYPGSKPVVAGDAVYDMSSEIHDGDRCSICLEPEDDSKLFVWHFIKDLSGEYVMQDGKKRVHVSCLDCAKEWMQRSQENAATPQEEENIKCPCCGVLLMRQLVETAYMEVIRPPVMDSFSELTMEDFERPRQPEPRTPANRFTPSVTVPNAPRASRRRPHAFVDLTRDEEQPVSRMMPPINRRRIVAPITEQNFYASNWTPSMEEQVQQWEAVPGAGCGWVRGSTGNPFSSPYCNAHRMDFWRCPKAILWRNRFPNMRGYFPGRRPAWFNGNMLDFVEYLDSNLVTNGMVTMDAGRLRADFTDCVYRGDDDDLR